jgi:hypothetical protein
MPKLMRVVGLVLFLAAVAAAPALAQSQATTGVIEGTVLDETGAAVPGASVTMRNTATNYERTATTDADGRFRGLLLPLGPYRVTVAKSGFATLVRDGINLAVGQTVNLTLNLKVSAVQEEVVVTGAAPLVETSRAEGSDRIDDAAIRGLPNNGRNFLDFTKLTPGVSIVQGPDGDELTINGQKGIANNISVDGADFNNPFFGEQRGGQRPPFTFNLDAVKEVVVVAEGAPAEFGRSSGGFVNVVTKSGTNQLHGTVHDYFKNQGLSSAPKRADGSSGPKTDFNQNQAGFTLGGPLVKDKAFFFVAFDYQRVGSASENGSIQRTNDARVLLTKVDWQLNPKHLLTLRYNYTWSDQKNGTFDVDSWGRSANADEKDYSNAGTFSLLSTFSGNTSNELRAQWAREDRPRPYLGPLITGQTRPLPDTAFDFAKSYRFGEPFFIPVTYHDTRLQFNDNITHIWGNHTFKAGFEYNVTAASQTFLGFANGRYIFSSTAGFLNYLANPHYVECTNGTASTTSQTGACPAGYSINGPVLLYLQQAGVGNVSVEQAGTQKITQKEPAVFLQDVFQPLPNLTIQAGLRWEAQLEPDPITPPSQVFYAGFIGATSKGQMFPSDGTIPSDKKMWQPRLGFSYDPGNDGKTVLRGSFGLYYARIPGLVLASSRSTNGSLGQSIFRASFFGNFGGPLPPAYPNLIPPSQIGSPDHPDVFVISKDFQNPRTTAFSLAAEREIVPGWAVGLKYNNAATDHLTRFINRNDPLFGSPWSTGLGTGGTNGIGVLTSVESTAKSRYWGLTLSVNKQFADNIGFQLNYTYSKDRSDDDNERDPFTFSYAKADDLGPEYGYSNRDQRHRLSTWLLWKAPGDVMVNARYSYRSAQPKSITATGADANTPQDRCSIINADGTCNAAAVVTQRNLGRKDNQFSGLDLRFSRVFQITGGLSIEPGIDIFNVFNSTNLRRPQVTNLVFNFDGTVQAGVGDPRQVQLGARISF